MSTPPASIARAHGPDYRAAIADPFGFLPATATAVGAVDLAHLRSTSLWQHWEPRLREQLDGTALGHCGADVLANTASLTVAVTTKANAAPAGIAVARGVDLTAFRACVGLAKGIAGPTFWLVARPIGPGTVVAVFGPNPLAPADLDRALVAGTSIAGAPGFDQALDQVDQHQALWFAIAHESSMLETFGAIGFPPDVAFGTFEVSDFLQANVHLRLASANLVTNFVAMAQGQLGGAKGFVQRLDVAGADRDVVLDLAINDGQLTQLLGIVGITPP